MEDELNIAKILEIIQIDLAKSDADKNSIMYYAIGARNLPLVKFLLHSMPIGHSHTYKNLDNDSLLKIAANYPYSEDPILRGQEYEIDAEVKKLLVTHYITHKNNTTISNVLENSVAQQLFMLDEYLSDIDGILEWAINHQATSIIEYILTNDNLYKDQIKNFLDNITGKEIIDLNNPLLLKNWIKYHTQNVQLEDALDYAFKKESIELIKVLINDDNISLLTDSILFPILIFFIKKNEIEVIKVILKKNPGIVTYEFEKNGTILYQAICLQANKNILTLILNSSLMNPIILKESLDKAKTIANSSKDYIERFEKTKILINATHNSTQFLALLKNLKPDDILSDLIDSENITYQLIMSKASIDYLKNRTLNKDDFLLAISSLNIPLIEFFLQEHSKVFTENLCECLSTAFKIYFSDEPKEKILEETRQQIRLIISLLLKHQFQLEEKLVLSFLSETYLKNNITVFLEILQCSYLNPNTITFKDESDEESDMITLLEKIVADLSEAYNSHKDKKKSYIYLTLLLQHSDLIIPDNILDVLKRLNDEKISRILFSRQVIYSIKNHENINNLCDSWQNLTIQDELTGSTFLHYAIACGNQSAIKILSSKVNPYIKDLNGCYPIELLNSFNRADKNLPSLINSLLSPELNNAFVCRNKNNILHLIINQRNEPLLNLFSTLLRTHPLEIKHLLESKNNNLRTPLELAIYSGNRGIIQEVFNIYASTLITEKFQMLSWLPVDQQISNDLIKNYLMTNLASHPIASYNLIRNYKGAIEEVDHLGNTFLHLAAKENLLQIIQLLSQLFDADILAKNNQGQTALDLIKPTENEIHRLIREKNTKSFRALIDGRNSEAELASLFLLLKNEQNQTPINLAYTLKNYQFIPLLTKLYINCLNPCNRLKKVLQLIKVLDIKYQAHFAYNLLFYITDATFFQELISALPNEIINVIININHDSTENTLLHFAITSNFYGAIEELLKNSKIDPLLKNKEGKTPLDLTNNPAIDNLFLDNFFTNDKKLETIKSVYDILIKRENARQEEIKARQISPQKREPVRQGNADQLQPGLTPEAKAKIEKMRAFTFITPNNCYDRQIAMPLSEIQKKLNQVKNILNEEDRQRQQQALEKQREQEQIAHYRQERLEQIARNDRALREKYLQQQQAAREERQRQEELEQEQVFQEHLEQEQARKEQWKQERALKEQLEQEEREVEQAHKEQWEQEQALKEQFQQAFKEQRQQEQVLYEQRQQEQLVQEDFQQELLAQQQQTAREERQRQKLAQARQEQVIRKARQRQKLAKQEQIPTEKREQEQSFMPEKARKEKSEQTLLAQQQQAAKKVKEARQREQFTKQQKQAIEESNQRQEELEQQQFEQEQALQEQREQKLLAQQQQALREARQEQIAREQVLYAQRQQEQLAQEEQNAREVRQRQEELEQQQFEQEQALQEQREQKLLAQQQQALREARQEQIAREQVLYAQRQQEQLAQEEQREQELQAQARQKRPTSTDLLLMEQEVMRLQSQIKSYVQLYPTQTESQEYKTLVNRLMISEEKLKAMLAHSEVALTNHDKANDNSCCLQ